MNLKETIINNLTLISLGIVILSYSLFIIFYKIDIYNFPKFFKITMIHLIIAFLCPLTSLIGEKQ